MAQADYEEDEFVIANASGGQALIGFSVIGKGNITRQLIDVPQECLLMNSSQEITTCYLNFESMKECEEHLNHVKEDKFSINVSTSFPVLNAGGAFHSSSQKSTATSSKAMVMEACVLSVANVPMGSVRISRDKMRLTKAAEEYALSIDSPRKAKQFLKTYNSHIFDGTYHLGGAFYRGMIVKASEVVDKKELIEAATKKLELEVSYKFMTAASSSWTSDNSFFQSRLAAGKEYSSKTISFVLGPIAQDAKEFMDKLERDRSSWRIIGHSQEDVFVPVWDIMERSGNQLLLQPAKMIREEWQSSVSTVVQKNPKIARMYEDSRICNSAHKSLEDGEKKPKAIPELQRKQIISPADLPQYLENLLHNNSAPQQCQELHNHVTKAVNDCVERSKDENIKNVVKRYGFNENGYWGRPQLLTYEQIETMIKELRNQKDDLRVKTFSTKGVVTMDDKFWTFHQLEENVTDLKGTKYTYIGDIVVDRMLQSEKEEGKRIVDCLRHRIQPFSSITASNDDEILLFDGEHEQLQESASTPIETLVQVIRNASLLATTALCKLLLEQRSAVPLMLPSTSTVNSLQFFQVNLGKQNMISLANDTKLFRVIFISAKNKDVSENATMATAITRCNFVSSYGANMSLDIPIVEIGIGFIPAKNDSNKYLPCICMCVLGDYEELKDFITSFANLIIEETGEDTGISDYLWESFPGKLHRKGKKIKGLFQDIKKQLLALVSKKLDEFITENERSLKDICSINSIGPVLKDSVARDKLELQKSFQIEGEAYFRSLGLAHDSAERRRMEVLCEEQVQLRKKLAPRVINLGIIQQFVQCLDHQDRSQRVLSVLQLQEAVKEKNAGIVKRAEQKKNELFDLFQKENSANRRKEYRKAQQQYVDKIVNLEHFWRELSHVFVSDPAKYDKLPKLAALHLLDGFPLEIMDGDAGMFSQGWVSRILDELDSKLKAPKVLDSKLKAPKVPKVFVLSVVGLQSSGKSTLLNLMFGTQLRTSAGQCTRGVYLQLVKSERKEYDYVLLLDTEGLRAPEFYDLEGAVVRDNRIATFAILPADACIILVSNEDDSGLKDVLPMVMLAFKRSSIGGEMKSKVFFLYRSIDTNDTAKLRSSQQKLQEFLQAQQVNNNTPDLPDGNLGSYSDFRIGLEEENSDVKYLGNLKKGSTPPDDVPDWEYGEKVMKAREYIHKRVTEGNWKAQSLVDWDKYLTLVWECICNSDFELCFKSTLDYWCRERLRSKISELRQEVSRKWVQEFDASMNLSKEEKESIEIWFLIVRNKVYGTIDDCSMKVMKLFEDETRCRKWQDEETIAWSLFLSKTEEQWRRKIQNCIDGVEKFDYIFTSYVQRSKMEIDKMFTKQGSKRELGTEDFETLFQNLLYDARQIYKPLANEVESLVNNCYNTRAISRQFNLDKDSAGPSARPGMIQNMKNATQRFFFGGSTSAEQDNLGMQKLGYEIQSSLKDVQQYTDAAVEDVIKRTNSHLKSLNLTQKSEIEIVHRYARDLVTEELTKSQKSWDNTRNVASRLETEKAMFEEFFKDRVKGLNSTDKLLSEMKEIFRSKWLECFIDDVLVQKFDDVLQRQSWVTNSQCWKAKLDLHLISLMNEGQITDMLGYIADGLKHSTHVLDSELKKLWFTPTKQTAYFQKFIKSFTDIDILDNPDKKIKRFLEQLKAQITSNKLAKLLEGINSQVYEKDEQHIEYEKVVTELSELMKTTFKVQYWDRCLLDKVIKRMRLCENESSRLRCSVECPYCGISCFHSDGHDGIHDTHHQPIGLRGIGWYKSHDLCAESCTTLLEKGRQMMNEETGIGRSFKEFDKIFPGWALPGRHNYSLEVREYVFFHYEDNLLRLYPKIKRCISMPQEYNHDIALVQSRLEKCVERRS